MLLERQGGEQTYFSGAQFIHFLLEPATVAPAIPLYREIAVIRKAFLPIPMGIAEKIGDVPSLTVVAAVLTGILGAVLDDLALEYLHIHDDAAQEMALNGLLSVFDPFGRITTCHKTLNQETDKGRSCLRLSRSGRLILPLLSLKTYCRLAAHPL